MSRQKGRKAAATRRRAHASRRRRVLAAIVGILGILVAAVGGFFLLRSESGPASERGVSAAPRRGIAAGSLAADFAVSTTDGKFRLSEQRGSVVVLDFLAPE